MFGSEARIIGNLFLGNVAGANGGGIAGSGCAPTVAGNIVAGNYAEQWAGGISFAVIDATVVNNTIVGNGSAWGGGGLSIWSPDASNPSSAHIANNVIAFNPGGGVAKGEYCTGTLDRNCVFGNDAWDYSWYDEPTGWWYDEPPPGATDFQADPLLVNWQQADCRLLRNSPCIDAGDNSWVPAWLTTDFYGAPRIFNGTVDVGAVEFHLSRHGP
jgi:predicted outer membrane repeat protein